MTDVIKKVTFSEKFGYLCSGLSYSICMMIPTFLIYYATEHLAIAIASVSLMMALVKIIDAFSDIVAGVIIDKTKSRFGLARPWFLRACIPYAICLVLMFSVPENMGTTGKLLFLAVFYALTVSVFGTLIGVARYAIVPRITADEKEQGALGVLGDGVGVVLVGVAMAITFGMIAKFGWTGTFVIYGIFVVVTALICFALTKEHPEAIAAKMAEEKAQKAISAKDFFMAIFNNKYALLAFIIVMLQQIGGGTILSCGTYYFQYVLGDLGGYEKMMGIAIVTCLVGMVLATLITKKIGPKKLFILGGALSIITYIVVLAAGTNRVMFITVTLAFTMMFCQSFLTTNFAAFSSNAVDYGYAKNGVRAEGITSSVINIGIKVGTALATAITGMIMASGGYIEGGAEQTAEAISSINVAFIGVPLIAFAAASLVVLFCHHIDKDLKKLSAKA